jgi:hypothetical protein
MIQDPQGRINRWTKQGRYVRTYVFSGRTTDITLDTTNRVTFVTVYHCCKLYLGSVQQNSSQLKMLPHFDSLSTHRIIITESLRFSSLPLLDDCLFVSIMVTSSTHLRYQRVTQTSNFYCKKKLWESKNMQNHWKGILIFQCFL